MKEEEPDLREALHEIAAQDREAIDRELENKEEERDY